MSKEKYELPSGLILRLKDLEIKKILVEFSGSGDSGGIDDIYLYNIEDIDILSSEYNEIDSEEKVSLRDKIETFAYRFIDAKINFNWWNNEGGRGSIEIDLIKNIIESEGQEYYTETIDHEFSDENLTDYIES